MNTKSTPSMSLDPSEPKPTPAPQAFDAASLVQKLRDTFATRRTRPLSWRLDALDGLRAFVTEQAAEIERAMKEDLGRPSLEARMTEVSTMRAEIKYVKAHLRAWMKPEPVPTVLLAQPGKSRIHREPLGVVLIIGAWNYPVVLSLQPLVGAIAAGNCAIVKPSEVAPAVSALLAEQIPRYVDPSCVQVVEGGVPETTALLRERFDHIFYTGNGVVGRIVLEAAAKHLTPTTLELGGKSPCIVDRATDLPLTVRRLFFGKFFNAGQTCVASDYVLAHEAIYEPLLEEMTATLRRFYGDDPQRSPDFGRIVNVRHHQRLVRLLSSGRAVAGGTHDEADRYIAPTILRDVPLESPAMNEEIFGPILPVFKIPSIDAAIRFINERPKPLALYLFSSDSDVQRRVIDETSAGGMCINHTFLHLACHGLPFGGVGPSGMGAYHGRASFETFSHRKSVLRKPQVIDPPILYPPYDEAKKRWLGKLM
jgi:aldehyde dehydrogenase (NAD+)